MLDSSTKKNIDDRRDILVGKVPDPRSQIDPITVALTYRRMHDMDQEAAEVLGIDRKTLREKLKGGSDDQTMR